MELINAAKNDDFDQAFSLLTSGFNANSRDKDNATPLYWSACRGNVQLCEVLIQAGGDVNAMVNWGSTPLHAATDRGHVESVEVLVQCRADVNLQNRRGDTALHIASFRGFMQISQILVRKGTNLFLKNLKDKTPHEEAMGGGHTDIANYLATAMQDDLTFGSRKPNPCQPTGYHVTLPEVALLSLQTGSQHEHYNVTNFQSTGSYCSTSRSDSPLTSEECGNEYCSYGNRSETEAVENQDDVYDSYSECRPSADTHNASEHRIDVIDEQMSGNITVRTYNRQSSLILPDRQCTNMNPVRRSHSVNSCCHDNICGHEKRCATTGSLTCVRVHDNTAPELPARAKSHSDLKNNKLTIPLIDGNFGKQALTETKAQSFDDLRRTITKYDIIPDHICSSLKENSHNIMKIRQRCVTGHSVNDPSKPAAYSSTPSDIVTPLSLTANEDQHISTDIRYMSSKTLPANECNSYIQSHITAAAQYANYANIESNLDRGQVSTSKSSNKDIPNESNGPYVNPVSEPGDRANTIYEITADLQRQLVESQQKCENVIKDNETLMIKYCELLGTLKALEARNEDTNSESIRLKTELDKNNQNEGGNVRKTTKNVNYLQKNNTTGATTMPDESLAKVIRLSEEPDGESRLYVNERDLKEELRRRFIATPLVEILDTPGREWTPGVDFVILGDKPISCQNEDEGGASVSVSFAIKHVKSGRKLCLKMRTPPTREDGSNSSAPTIKYRLLHGHSHRNIEGALHSYDGPMDRFRKFLPVISLATRGVHSATTVSIRTDISIRASFVVTRHFPFTLQSYSETVICNRHLDKQDSTYGLSTLFFLQVLYQVLSALDYLHKRGIVHRALSPDVILLDGRLRPVVSNFTHALMVTGSDNQPLQFRSKEEVVTGTQCAWTPELLYFHQSGPSFTTQITLKDIYDKSDLFALGQLFYCILSGLNGNDIYVVNRQGSRELPPLPTSLPVGLRHVIHGMVHDNPGNRPSAQQCIFRSGVLLWCTRHLEVIPDQSSLQINMAARMLKLVSSDARSSRSCLEDQEQPSSLEENVAGLGADIEADILCNIDHRDFWHSYCAMRDGGLLSVNTD